MQGTCETYSLPGAKHPTGRSSIRYVSSTSGWYLLSVGSPNEPCSASVGMDVMSVVTGRGRRGLTEDAVRLGAGIEGPECICGKCIGVREEFRQGHVHERPCHEHDTTLLSPIPVDALRRDIFLVYEPRKKYPCQGPAWQVLWHASRDSGCRAQRAQCPTEASSRDSPID